MATFLIIYIVSIFTIAGLTAGWILCSYSIAAAIHRKAEQQQKSLKSALQDHEILQSDISEARVDSLRNEITLLHQIAYMADFHSPWYVELYRIIKEYISKQKGV